MTLLAMLRHGPTEWNRAKKLQGMSDIPLSAEGREAVAAWRVPEEFKRWRWIASPLVRAQETARLVGAPAEMQPEPLLREMSFGQWEGRTIAELVAEGGADFQAIADRGLDMQPPGGESPRMVIARLMALCQRVAADGIDTVAVCHKGIIRALLAQATGWSMLGRQPYKLDWSALHCFRLAPDGTPTIERLNIALKQPVGSP
ncbi:MAG: histidine phosphatase family protein [Rhodospirillales bacterium]